MMPIHYKFIIITISKLIVPGGALAVSLSSGLMFLRIEKVRTGIEVSKL